MTHSVKRRPLVGLVATLAVAALGLGGCSAATKSADAGKDKPAAAQEGTWPRTVKTDDGEVTIKEKPKKIVSTSVTLTGSLLALDAPVVATPTTRPNLPGLSDAQGFFTQWAKQAHEKKLKPIFQVMKGSVEKVAVEQPDLIVVSKTGGDSMFKEVEHLRQVAPVVVVDYLGRSWQDVDSILAKATGTEKQAKKLAAEFSKKVAETKAAIKLPAGTTTAFYPPRRGDGIGLATKESPQGRLLTQLGFKLTDIPQGLSAPGGPGPKRKDVVNVSAENIQRALTGDNWVVMGVDKKRVEKLQTDPIYAKVKPTSPDKVIVTPPATWRLDYFSALIFLKSIREHFAK